MMGCDTNLGGAITDAEQTSRASDGLANLRAGSFDGIFALSEAEPPKGMAGEKLGSLAWWNDFSSQQLFLYGRLVRSPDDVNHALINLERDLGVDSSALMAKLPMIDGESNAANQPEDSTTWQPASYTLALEIMGFDPSEFVDARKDQSEEVICIAAKSLAAKEASMKSAPSPLKAILLASQASCGGGNCNNPCSCADCNDENVCNGIEGCDPDSGCTYGPPLECNDHNWCNGFEYCSPEAGGCVQEEPPVCDDDNVCNGLEFCLDNDLVTGCQPGTPLDCSDDGNVCNGPEFCDSSIGCQSGPPVMCDDNNACNGIETCHATLGCLPGIPLVCDDNNKCNGLETCVRPSGCESGTPLLCDDGDSCNGLETCVPALGCQSGIPKNCDDSNECTIDNCANSICIHTRNFERPPCDDGTCCGDDNPNTIDTCVCADPPECTVYGCSHAPICDDSNPCTSDTCNPDSSGVCNENTSCNYTPRPNCTGCGSGYCLDGVCQARSCNVSLFGATGCPGSAFSMDVTLTSCSTASTTCGDIVAWSVSESSPDVSLSGGGSITCPSGSGTVNGTISANASPGSASVTITGNMGGISCLSYSTVTIDNRVDLTFAGLADADETTVGGFLLVNDNDSNNDGQPDYLSMSPLGDPDIKILTVNLDAALLGTVNITCVGCNSKIRLYTEQGATNPQLTGLVAADFPLTLLVEGISTSGSAKDVEIKATYTGDDGPCEDVVNATVFSVQPVKVDATDPHAVMVKYHIDPHDILLDSATFTAPGTTLTSTSLPTDFNFVFDQSDLFTGDNTIQLVGSMGGSQCDVEVIASRTNTKAPSQGDVSEIAVYRIIITDGIVTVPVTHSIFSEFSFICYSIPIVAGSKTLWFGDASVNIRTPESTEIPTLIAAWTELLILRNDSGDLLQQIMVNVIGPTLPPQSPNFLSKDISIDEFFRPGLNLTANGLIDNIVFTNQPGGILFFPIFPEINTEVDLALESLSNIPVMCP